MKKPTITIIYTGGTIGMAKNPETRALQPLDFNRLLEIDPELKKINCTIKTITTSQPKDSSDIHPDDWLELIRIIKNEYDHCDGFVVLHGTDTLAFTASMISFLIENNQKPIIFTGSQLPVGVLRTDAKENLITSIEIAATQIDGRPVVPEVAVYFEYKLYRGNRVKKISAEHFNAFHSPNYPVLAEAGVHLKINHPFILEPDREKPVKFYEKIHTGIATIKFFPGINEDVFEYFANKTIYEALVMETYGSGNAPFNPKIDQSIKKINETGRIVLNITQCLTGHVDQNMYATGLHLKSSGAIGGHDMTFEAAVCKLMFLLANFDKATAKKLVSQNLRGEISRPFIQ